MKDNHFFQGIKLDNHIQPQGHVYNFGANQGSNSVPFLFGPFGDPLLLCFSQLSYDCDFQHGFRHGFVPAHLKPALLWSFLHHQPDQREEKTHNLVKIHVEGHRTKILGNNIKIQNYKILIEQEISKFPLKIIQKKTKKIARNIKQSSSIPKANNKINSAQYRNPQLHCCCNFKVLS